MKDPRLAVFLSSMMVMACAASAQVSVKVHPVRAPLTLTQSQQFSAVVANTTNHGVTWWVDGVKGGNSTVGTITTSGVYRPPAVVGTHTVTAKSVVQTTATGTATVWITNYPGMYTYHADKFRSGVNSQELALTPASVNKNTFGKLFHRVVDGQIYAQPLIVNNLTIAGAKHNVVIIATEHDSVYAFDADGKISTPFWHRSFINPTAGVTTIPMTSSSLIEPETGITGTPAIDTSTNTIYVAVSTKESGTYVHRLHALSLTTGAEKFGGPVVISGSVPGTYPPLAVNGRVPFAGQHHMQRPALLALSGVVYVAFGSFGDNLPYNGWLFAYTANGTGRLHQVGIFCTSPDQGASAVWLSGAGPSADNSNFIYVDTGNGAFDLNSGGHDAGDSVLKLQLTSAGLALADYFTPANQATFNSNDLDLGSTGALVAPTQAGAAVPDLLVVGDKEGKLYLINRQNMGRYNGSTDTDVETLTLGQPEPTNGMWGIPAMYNQSLYVSEMFEPLKLFTFSNGLLPSTATAMTPNTFAYPGTAPMISTNNGANNIVWTLDVAHFVGYPNSSSNQGPAVLYAYNAGNLQELYNSSQAGTRDTAGKAIKFTSPTISNGRVYVGTASELDVYGFLP
jgi:hypothetical protein